MSRCHLAAAAVLAAGVVACSEDPVVVSLEITPGHELDAFSREPPISRVDVSASTPEGDLTFGASSTPGGSFDLGEVPEDRLLSFEVTGYDIGGVVAVRGRSLSVVIGGVQSDVLPLFAQRLGQWARPPGGLAHTHVGGVTGVLGERFLLLTGGQTVGSEAPSAAAPSYYDLLALGASSGAELPRVAESMMMGADGISAILVNSDGATWVDYDSGASYEVALPQGLQSFGEVAGGTAVQSADGTVLLVGATRAASAPTSAVLVWPSGGQLSVARLAHERQGAAAAWLDDVGLAVAGGSATAPGLEILAAGATQAASRPYPADETSGAAAIGRGGGQVMLLGGVDGAGAAPTRVLSAPCVTDCLPQVLGTEVPAPMASCHAFSLDPDHVVLLGADLDDPVTIGSDSVGLTRTFAVDLIAETVTELGLREPRAGAVGVPTPNGSLALLGGVHPDGTAAETVEMLFTGL